MSLLEPLLHPEPRAVIFLIIVLVALLGRIAWWFRYGDYTCVQSFFLFIATVFVRILWRAQVPPWPLAPGQAALLVSNHRSSIDPFFMQAVAPRPVHWMVAREYCEHPILGPLLRIAEVISTNRTGIDTAATKTAIRLAASGGCVGMFPEGRINMTSELLQPGRPGAILVALKARVPILPCYIEGAPYGGTALSPLVMSAKVKVRFGQLIDLTPYFDRDLEDGLLGELLLRTLKSIAALAGQPDYRPRLAGRRWKPTEDDIARDTAALRT